jgi:iron-sulfur cluster assembly protein
MLRLTPNTARVITEVVAETDLDQGAGLRIAATRRDDEGVELELSMESAPAEGDAVVELDGARVFLEPLASAVLDDRVLDAHMHGDKLHFEMQPQSPARDE